MSQPLLFVPIQNVLLFRFIFERPYFFKISQLIKLLDEIESEKPFVAMTNVSHAEVQAISITHGTDHQIYHDFCR